MASRLARVDLLRNPSRRFLFEHICRAPGVSFLQCLRLLRQDPVLAPKSGHGMLMHHLYQLERYHLVTSVKSGRFRRYFQNGGRFGRAAPQIGLLQAPPMPMIARILLDQPGITQQDLRARLLPSYRSTRQSLAYHLDRLRAHGLVEKVEQGAHTRYYPLEAMRDCLAFVPGPGDAPAPPLPPATPVPVEALPVELSPLLPG